MDLDELQTIQNRERQTDSLQSLPGSFYEEVAAYVRELREERERVAEEEGFDAPEFRRLSDEIDAAEDTVESIYERRVGKVVKAASFAAAGMPAQNEGLTEEEVALFETLVDDIERNRERVLAVLSGDAPGDEPAGDADARADASSTDGARATGDGREPAAGPGEGSDVPEAGVDAADVMGGPAEGGTDRPDPSPPDEPDADDAADVAGDGDGRHAPDPAAPTAEPDPRGEGAEPAGATAEEEEAGPTVDRATVRITSDVGEILGVDERAYDLSRDDVVTLPEANAGPLVDRDAAERLD